MENKTKNYMIMAVWIGYVILTYAFYNKFVQMALNGGLVIGLLIFVLTNPAYIALAYYISKTSMSKIKAVIASLFITISFAIVGSPRDMLANKILNLDTIVLKYFTKAGLSPNLSILIYYVILPVLFGFLALELLGYTSVLKKIKSGG